MTLVAEHAAGHDVLFSESDEELVRVLADRLSPALLAEAAVIVIATPGHLLAFECCIRASGVDVEAACRRGSLLLLDATETLERLSPRGVFDPQAFAAVVGAGVRAAAATRPVHAFGEMVALLWEAGRIPEAIELEKAWEELVQETSTSVLCAYPSRLVDDPAHWTELETVCSLHSSVVSEAPLERTWEFPADVSMVPQMRRLVTNALRARGVAGQALSDAQVVIAELMSNALVHGGSPLAVSVSVDRSRIHLQVRDDSADLPTVRPSTDHGLSGRGLLLIDALSHRWGVEPLPLGKHVWAELAR